jgi:hypothetical protein
MSDLPGELSQLAQFSSASLDSSIGLRAVSFGGFADIDWGGDNYNVRTMPRGGRHSVLLDCKADDNLFALAASVRSRMLVIKI